MARKAISALLVVAIAAWAEITLGPLLSIHAHAEMAQVSPAEHQHAMPAQHPCCPKTQHAPVAAVPLYQISSTGLACADEHRCCFRHGPQNPPAPAGTPSRISKDNACGATTIPSSGQSYIVAEFTAPSAHSSPPGELNMVLRI